MERLTEKITDMETGNIRAYHLKNNAPYEVSKAIERLGKYEDLDRQGLLIKLPCKIGDEIYLRVACECICTEMDSGTGAILCPFEDDCEFEDCENGNERLFKTTIENIFNNGFGWHCTLKEMNIDISLSDFGKTVFLSKDRAEQWLNKMEE